MMIAFRKRQAYGAAMAKYLKEDFNPSSPYYNMPAPSKIKLYAKDIM